MSKLYFTRVGAERIMRQKQQLLEELKSTQKQKGEAVKSGGNEWHDNFSFEQLTLSEQRISVQISEINEKISKMLIIDRVSPDTSRLRLGHVATLNIEGEEKTFLIGGFEDFDMESTPPVVSYLAPIVSQFIGEERGHVAGVEVGGSIKFIMLQDIRLQQKKEEE